MDEALLGIQLRVPLTRLERWPTARRAQYLLLEQTDIPLSVDKTVWPAIEDRKLLSEVFLDDFAAGDAVPNGLNVYSISDVSLSGKAGRFKDSVMIAVTVIGKCGTMLKAKHHIKEPLVSLEQLKLKKWRRLGYDVADHWLRSGLVNCSYSPHKKEELGKRFCATLNHYGLFESAEIAQEFCIDCDRRVPEHAPFCVFGIWTRENLVIPSELMGPSE